MRKIARARGAGASPGVPSYVLGLSALAFLAVMVATIHGPGLDPDSVRYVSTGVNLAHGHGLVDLTGQPLTVFAPGVSAITAAGVWVGLPAEEVIRCLNAACAAAIVLLGHLLLRRAQLRPFVLIGATALLALSPTVMSISKMANSEAPFVVVTLAFLLVLEEVWTSRRLTNGRLAALVLLVWIAFLLRYAGGCLVAVGVCALGWRLRPIDRSCVGRTGAFVALSASVPVGWLLRNHASDGTWLGPRVPSPDTPGDVLERLSSTAGRWLLGGGTGGPIAVAVGAVLVMGVATLLVADHRRRRGGPDPLPGVIGVLSLFIGVYVAYMAYAQLTTGIDPLDIRLLAPAYVPFLVLLARCVDQALTLCEGSSQPGTATRVALIGLVIVALQAGFSLRSTLAEATDGIGFNSAASLDSALAVATESAATPDTVVISNSVEDLWAATGRQPLRSAPAFAGIRGVPLRGEAETLARDIACSGRPMVLAMYRDGDPKALGTDELREVVHLDALIETDDGVLYRVRPLDPARPVGC